MSADDKPAAPAGAGKRAVPIARALELAGQLYLAGRLGHAEQLCRQILERRPSLAEAHNILGVVLSARGDYAASVAELRLAARLDPRNASFHANLGEVERQRGELEAARAALERSIALDATNAQAYNNLGIVNFDQKDYAAAAECYRKALALRPAFPEAHNNLGNAYRALEDPHSALACYEAAVTHKEAYPEAYNNMGASLRDLEDFEASEHAYRKAILQKPDYLEAHNNLAILLLARSRTDEALRVLAEALKVNEHHVPTLLNVARVQLERGGYDPAERAAQAALEIEPQSAEAYATLAQIFHELDRYAEALKMVERALELAPDAADARNFYAVALKSVGRLDEARAELHKILAANPRNYAAYSNLVDLETFTRESERFQGLEAIFAEAEDDKAERYMPLHFVYGKALEDVGDYAGAMRHFQQGARMRRRQLDYSEEDTFRFFDDIIRAFPKERLDAPPWPGDPSPAPVFIIGMPRSGSTLVEQILSSHPQVHGAGEVKVLHRRLGMLRDRYPSIPKFPAMMDKLTPAHLATIARGYLEELQQDAGGAARVTDKLLTNYFFLGLLRALFPNAKFIHTRRNPVDTCLSAFTKLFRDDMPHSYDLAELGRYYLKYEELMRHWEAVLPPGVMLTVQYETVIADFEASARAIVGHVGLPWDDACLSFDKSDRPVKTASVVQVRKPVYATSVERWRRYGEALRPLLDALRYDDAAASTSVPRRRRGGRAA